MLPHFIDVSRSSTRRTRQYDEECIEVENYRHKQVRLYEDNTKLISSRIYYRVRLPTTSTRIVQPSSSSSKKWI
jgi:hypothetical protein